MIPKAFSWIILWIGLSMTDALAQEKDSVVINKNPHFVLSLDTRSTIIDHQRIRINGVLSGMTFGEKNHKITVGYYWLGYDAARRLINWRKKLAHSINLSYYTKTDVAFISFAYWLPVIKKNQWTLSVPIEFGFGQESAHYRELTSDNNFDNKHFRFQPFQAGVYCEYRVTPWAGIETQVGYRNAISETSFRRKFAGIYYSYGISLYPGTIYRDYKIWRDKRRAKKNQLKQ